MGMELGGGGQERGKSKRRSKLTPSMNVTPLVDVVLVLLIIFLVITPMLTRQMGIKLPQKEQAEPAPPDPDEPTPVVLTIDAEDRIRINRDEVDLAELEPRLARILAAKSDKILFFGADDRVPYGRAMEVMDAARGAGGTVAVLTEPLGE